MADVNSIVARLERMVKDNEYPFTPAECEEELLSCAASLGYESIEDIPLQAEGLVLLKAQINLYYALSGLHAKNYRVRIEGDMEIHSQQVAENYLKLAFALERRLEKEMERLGENIEVIEATRYRVSTIGNVPRSTGVKY